MFRWTMAALLAGFLSCGTATPFERGEQRATVDAGSGSGAGAGSDAGAADGGSGGGDAGAVDGGSGGAMVDAGSGAVALSFATSVEPILQSKCASCHATFGGSLRITGTASTDYTSVQPYVNTGSPSQSLVVRKPTGQESHGGGTVFQTDSSEYSTILQWITDGANP